MRKPIAGLLIALALTAPGRAPAQTAAGKQRYRFTIKSALVTPGRPDGRKWRGNGKLSPEVVKGLGKFAAEAAKLVMDGKAGGALVAAAAEVGIPWLADVMSKSDEAPNVALTIWQRGLYPLTFPRDPGSANTINPTWPSFHTGEIDLDPGDELTIEARDVDDKKTLDRIGICTVVAPPRLDAMGFVTKESIRCEGGLLAVSLRAQQVSTVQPPTPYVPFPTAIRAITVAPPASAGTGATTPAVPSLRPLQPLRRLPANPAYTTRAPVLETAPPVLRPAAADPIATRLTAAERALPAGATRVTNIFHNELTSSGSIDIPVLLGRGCYRIVAASQKTGALMMLSLQNGWADSKVRGKPVQLTVSADPDLGQTRPLCVDGGSYRISVGAFDGIGAFGVAAYRLSAS